MSVGRSSYLNKRACPSCNCEDSLPFIASIPPGEGESLEVLTESWFGFFKQKVFFTYARCTQCGILFSPFYFNEKTLGELYSKMPDNTAGVDQRNLVETQKGYLKALGSGFEVRGDYFELGPDIGLLTEAALPLVRGHKLWLFEPNIAVHEELGRRVHGNRTVISPEMTNFDMVPDGTIGLCTMIHVLDHLPDASSIVRQLARKLSPDGRMLIVTHDESSLLARVLKRRWPAYCLQHPHLFNPGSTETFLRSCGLRTLSSHRAVNHFPVVYLLKHLLFALGLKSAGNWKVWGPTISLGLGNRITVAVKAN